MRALPKHRAISRELLAEISAGKYPTQTRLPSETQLVKRFGVSRPTVIRALRDLQVDGFIERRAGSGSYVRHRTSDASPASRQFGLLVPARGTTDIFELICGELAAMARAEDYGVLWGSAPLAQEGIVLSARDALNICAQFIEQRVAGVFFAPFDLAGDEGKANSVIAERFRSAGIPVVLLDRDLLPFPHRSTFDVVGIDNFGGGVVLAEHLIKLGCEQVAFVSQRHAAPSIDARIAGVREVLLRREFTLRSDWVQLGDPDDVKFVRRLTAAKRWDAFICANDLTAAKLMRRLEKVRVRVPEDVRVVGFDDAKYATLLGVSLTTIHQPTRDIAMTAFRAMRERMTEPVLPVRNFLLSPRLIVRESCGAYLSAPKRKRSR